MVPKIFHTQESTEFYTPERCHIIEIMNKDGIDFSIARARVEPGIATALHSLNGTSESYYILSGSGVVQFESGEENEVGPGDVVMFPPHSSQTIRNIGQKDLIFLCFCVPRFRKEVYQNLEKSTI